MGAVRDHDLLGAVEGADNVDGAGEDDVEVIGGVALGVQDITGDRAPPTGRIPPARAS